jgi:hypothetical protein
MSYAYAARTTKSEIPFGKGAIAGVIAPEAANNSKEGGAMIPTLFFGIPGSSGMAVMMAALAFVGVSVGPSMLTTHVGLSYSLAATVVLANLLAIPAFFAVVPSIVRLSALRREAIVPIAISISVMAALIDNPTLATVVEIFIAAVFGVGLKLANWPRAPFILGFVIAELAEESYFLTASIWGWSALTRPITVVLIVAVAAWLAFSVRRRPPVRIAGPRMANLVFTSAMIAFFCLTFLLSVPLGLQSGLAPTAISLFAFALCVLILLAALKASEPPQSDEVLRFIGPTGAFIAAMPFIGILPASFTYIVAVLIKTDVRPRIAVLIAIGCCLAQLALFASVFDVLVEREILGRILWAALGY